MLSRKSSVNSPLCYEDYNIPTSKLPRAHAPAWASWMLLLSLLGLLGFSVLTLDGSMDEFVMAQGEVRPRDYTILFSTAPGVLQELLVRDGDEVSAGDVVARVWFLPEQVAIDPQGLRPFEIKSPESGRVISTARLFQGERVGLGEPLVKLVRGDERDLRIYASEDRIDRIVPGLEVRFRVRSNPDRLAPAAIGRITSVAKDKDLMREDKNFSSAPSYYVKASVDYAEYELPFGAQIDAEIVLGKRKFWELLLLRLLHKN